MRRETRHQLISDSLSRVAGLLKDIVLLVDEATSQSVIRISRIQFREKWYRHLDGIYEVFYGQVSNLYEAEGGGNLCVLDGQINDQRFQVRILGVGDESSDWRIDNDDGDLAGCKSAAGVARGGRRWEGDVHEVLERQILHYRLGQGGNDLVLILKGVNYSKTLKLIELTLDCFGVHILTLVAEATSISQDHV